MTSTLNECLVVAAPVGSDSAWTHWCLAAIPRLRGSGQRLSPPVQLHHLFMIIDATAESGTHSTHSSLVPLHTRTTSAVRLRRHTSTQQSEKVTYLCVVRLPLDSTTVL